MRHATTLALLSMCILTGCSSGKRISKANDALRLEREALKEQVTSLENENAELHVKIAELMQGTDPDTAALIAAMPKISKIELTKYCQIEETDDGPVAIFFVATKDGEGRFTQALGELKVAVNHTEIPDMAFDTPHDGLTDSFRQVLLGSRTIDAQELRASYVSGLMGTAYMIRVPLEKMPTYEAKFFASFKDPRSTYWLDDSRAVKP